MYSSVIMLTSQETTFLLILPLFCPSKASSTTALSVLFFALNMAKTPDIPQFNQIFQPSLKLVIEGTEIFTPQTT